jgi:hypothetical protein
MFLKIEKFTKRLPNNRVDAENDRRSRALRGKSRARLAISGHDWR